jgi:protein ImuB
MLWLALYFRHLPIETSVRSRFVGNTRTNLENYTLVSSPLLPPSCALVVSDNINKRICVYAANDAAIKSGIRIGMSLASAKVLNHELVAIPRDKGRESHALKQIADRLLLFSPAVSIHKEIDCANVAIEISRSLRLFGGVDALLNRISALIAQLGHVASYAIAPTAIAAEVLSRISADIGKIVKCLSPESLREKITAAPINYFAWPNNTKRSLGTLGLYTFGDVLRQPFPSLRRRFGSEFVLELEKVLGLVDDIRDYCSPSSEYERHLDFMFEINDRSLLLSPTQLLLNDLEEFLRLRGAGVSRLSFEWIHSRAHRTVIEAESRVCTRKARYWFAIIKERIDRLSPSDGVFEIALHAKNFVRIDDENIDLFHDNAKCRETRLALFDRISSSKENCRIHRIAIASEHRPELAFRSDYVDEPPLSSRSCLRKRRPIMFLREPKSLLEEEGYPQYNGVLTLVAGPERIDTGWWDNKPVARDYFVAINPKREVCWIFRDYRQGRKWYLHGFFS